MVECSHNVVRLSGQLPDKSGYRSSGFRFRLVVRPLPDDRLDGFQADFSLLLGAGFADPDYATALGARSLFVEDKFKHLAAPKVETSAQPEAFFRGIEDEAGVSRRLAVQIDDKAGAPLRHNTLRAAGFRDRKAGHSFTHESTSSDITPGLVSFEMRNDASRKLRSAPSSKLLISRVVSMGRRNTQLEPTLH
jgi:hypothetical protein